MIDKEPKIKLNELTRTLEILSLKQTELEEQMFNTRTTIGN